MIIVIVIVIVIVILIVIVIVILIIVRLPVIVMIVIGLGAEPSDCTFAFAQLLLRGERLFQVEMLAAAVPDVGARARVYRSSGLGKSPSWACRFRMGLQIQFYFFLNWVWGPF